MTLQEAKQAVRAFIRTWSDQRLAEVYAFNTDGKMSYYDTCGCICGVATVETLHNQETGKCPNPGHYSNAHATELAGWAEAGYGYLGLIGTHAAEGWYLRRYRLSVILRAEMRLRSGARASRPTVYTEWVTSHTEYQGTK